MKIALLGYGKEGQAAEKYFKEHFDAECEIFQNFTPEEVRARDYSSYDIIMRSPSVPPLRIPKESSVTKYFFDHCPCPIIGVTGTKGKGTTCSLIHAILEALGRKSYLVGNIGMPAITVLDDLTADDVVVYEMSSFQLWDLEKSPRVAVVLRIEADHLNVHDGFDDYVGAKGHIVEYQSADDIVVYFRNNQWSAKLAEKSAGRKIPYPLEPVPEGMGDLLDNLTVPGMHNRENAEAALLAVAGFLCLPVESVVSEHYEEIAQAFRDFKGLPHHIEYVRTLNGVDYYDDSFSASYPSLDVAIKTFADRPLVLIAGGKDRGLDLGLEKRAIFDAPNIVKAILIGETKQKLAEGEDSQKYELADTLPEAVRLAKVVAESVGKAGGVSNDAADNAPVVLLSPGAASFDMFRDFYDRGEQFKAIVEGLQ